jgi:hypothetical protein
MAKNAQNSAFTFENRAAPTGKIRKTQKFKTAFRAPR